MCSCDHSLSSTYFWCTIMLDNIFAVKLSHQALKSLKKLSWHIAVKLQAWIDDVGYRGLNEVKKIPGYHDEPLYGQRLGQRSIRLNKAYRAIYRIEKDKRIRFIEIVEVNKHEY